MSVDSAGIQANSHSFHSEISDNGRFVAFSSGATNLASGDTNAAWDVFVHDRETGATERVSLTSSGAQANGDSAEPAMSDDGRFVVFVSTASNLVDGDTNGGTDVFVRDRQSGVTQRVSVASNGDDLSGVGLFLTSPAISGDGLVVAFSWRLEGTTTGQADLLIHSRETGDTNHVSTGAGNPSLSFDGGWLAFDSERGISVYHRETQATELLATPDVSPSLPSINDGGRFVAYQGATGNFTDQQIYVLDRVTDVVEQISRGAAGEAPNDGSGVPAIAGNGRTVAFQSFATNLVPGGSEIGEGIFVFDRETEATELVSLNATGEQVGLGGFAFYPSLSGDGQLLPFESAAEDVVPDDTNAAIDVFVRDRGGVGPPPPPPDTLDYLALGDSYASGEGNPPFDVGTDVFKRKKRLNGCHRSDAAWPRLLGVALVNHLACSGAKLRDVTKRGQEALAPDDVPQIQRLSNIEASLSDGEDHVDIVTLTIGGNDIGFADILGDCFIRECLARFNRNQRDVRNLHAPLVRALDAIQSAAPHARVVLVGYPRIFPSDQNENVACGWLTPLERIRANTLALELDMVQRLAAQEAGAEFVSVTDALDGHELCAADSWMFELNPLLYGTDQRQAHPLFAGQEAIETVVREYLGL